MWDQISDDVGESYRWMQNYGIPNSKVLGKLGCLVLSKILESGSAERHYKIQKLMMRGQRANLGPERAKKQGLCYSRYMETKWRNRSAKLSAAGIMWEDEDFISCKLDKFCRDLAMDMVVGDDDEPVRRFNAWQEQWEKRKIGPQGDSVFEARLVRKYGGLKWVDCDEGDILCKSHPDHMWFEKKRGQNRYHVIGMNEGYNQKMAPQNQEDKWSLWSCDEALYTQIAEYYEDRADEVKVIKKDDDGAESDAD